MVSNVRQQSRSACLASAICVAKTTDKAVYRPSTCLAGANRKGPTRGPLKIALCAFAEPAKGQTRQTRRAKLTAVGQRTDCAEPGTRLLLFFVAPHTKGAEQRVGVGFGRSGGLGKGKRRKGATHKAKQRTHKALVLPSRLQSHLFTRPDPKHDPLSQSPQTKRGRLNRLNSTYSTPPPRPLAQPCLSSRHFCRLIP